MHEMSIAQNILDIIHQELRKHNCVKLSHVKICCGALSQVVPDSLQFCFEALIKGTVHEGACLELEEVPLVLRCHNCQKDFQPDEVMTPCPSCNTTIGHEVVTGRELYVAHLEAE